MFPYKTIRGFELNFDGVGFGLMALVSQFTQLIVMELLSGCILKSIPGGIFSYILQSSAGFLLLFFSWSHLFFLTRLTLA